MSDLSERIRIAIGKSEKSQFDVAREIGITEVSLSRYVHGKRVPKAVIIPRIAKACGVSEKWLLTGEEPFDSHIEMIIDYTTDGTDFNYSDNHGVLTRCKDCEYYWENYGECVKSEMNKGRASALPVDENFFCGYGARRAKDDK